MADEQPTAPPDVAGEAKAPGSASDVVAELRRKRHQKLAEHQQRKRGRPAKVANAAPGEPQATVVDPQASIDSLRRKVGVAFRATGMGLALSTNCSVWLVTPDEEKLLGEGIGDVCAELGLADTFAIKAIFAFGIVGGVFGPKALGYAAFVSQQRELAEAVKKGKDAPPRQPEQRASPDSPAASNLPETKPGLQ